MIRYPNKFILSVLPFFAISGHNEGSTRLAATQQASASPVCRRSSRIQCTRSITTARKEPKSRLSQHLFFLMKLEKAIEVKSRCKKRGLLKEHPELLGNLQQGLEAGHEAAGFGEVGCRHQVTVDAQGRCIVPLLNHLHYLMQAVRGCS